MAVGRDRARISAEMMLEAYTVGIFPMAMDRRSSDLVWMEPRYRGIIDPGRFAFPRRLRRYMKSSSLVIRFDTSFDEVLASCALERPARLSTWISERMVDLYRDVYRLGRAWSVGVWDTEASSTDSDRLVGGLFGITLGGAFVGESMFSLVPRASQFALVALVKHLCACGYTLLDCQFHNEHLAKFSCQQIPREDYLERLADAMELLPRPLPGAFDPPLMVSELARDMTPLWDGSGRAWRTGPVLSGTGCAQP